MVCDAEALTAAKYLFQLPNLMGDALVDSGDAALSTKRSMPGGGIILLGVP